MSFWIVVTLLCLAAVGFAAWPLWRESHRLTPLVASVIVLTVALSAALYSHVGSPGVPSGRSGAMAGGDDELPGMDAAIASLEKRLDNNPGDVAGWKMLGRTHMAMNNYDGAVAAFEQAMTLENGQVAQTLVDLALAIANRDGVALQDGRAVDLFDSAMKLDPNNQPALFYSGMAAANRGETDAAADLWEKLLGLNPPADVRGILEQNIAAWRGEAPPPAPVAAAPAQEEIPADAVISASISLSSEALAMMPAEASVFIIARDPAVPTPPIAVARRNLSELPATVSLSDAQSMVEGRNLSAFAEIELLARVSLSGGPAAQSGDWFGSTIVRPAESNAVSLTIDQQVP